MLRRWIWCCGLASLALLSTPRAAATQLCQDVLIAVHPAGNGVAATPIYQRQCRWVAGAVAFDLHTRAFSSTWNYEDPDQALAEAVGRCGTQCVGQSFFTDFIWVAMADDDRAYGLSMNNPDEALRQCTNAGGLDCAVVLGGSSTAAASYWSFSALSYDAASGASGRSIERARRRDAIAEATAQCGASGCWTYAYQGGYAAIARSSDGRLFAEWSGRDGLLANASRKARNACRKATGDKSCEVVVSSDVKSAVAEASRRADEAERRLREELERIDREYGKSP